MDAPSESTDIPLLLVYNLDQQHWDHFEIESTLYRIELLSTGLKNLGYPLTVLPVYTPDLANILRPYSPQDYLLFNLCEELPGIPRSSGQAAEIIENLGFYHTGASAHILSFSQDKINVKYLLDRHGISTPVWRAYDNLSEDGWHQFPAIVKPSCEHCSVGIEPQAVVANHQQLTYRIKHVLEAFNQPALVEDFIHGREFRVSVIGNGAEAKVLPPGEMDYSNFQDPSEHLLCYDSKMNPDSKYFNQIKVIVNPSLSDEERSQLETTALRVFEVLECRDYAGFDFRLRDGIFYVVDANPDPEFSPESSLALGAEAIGLPYIKLASFVINQAVRRHPILGPRFTH
ncbi:MAG: ATP-grasp domain-containing protein [Anaerolineae bacterium]|nr:ATP-grasp domain-containing protein [Anaerolineae bacterium]